ncbi:MAG: D-alanyl-lipoteichoic acid acyltransferase DltB (MBOAT superfamily) [Roseivirga sp.]|jgi:D-alanyl-lipoteichoic acid acyltransferase DltB (MBOAT superfamily)
MTFISVEFLGFFLLVFTSYFLLALRWRWILILVASYFFYGYHNPAYIFLLLTSTFIDFYAGKHIARSRDKCQSKAWLYSSIIANLSILFFFKYFNFFIVEINTLSSFFSLSTQFSTHSYLLPLGISFYTFQSLGYSIDIYRGYIKPETHFGKFALYLSFFPQLVAGPIERARKLLPQLSFRHEFQYQRVVDGLRLMLWGFFKKIVVADRLGVYVNEVFEVSNNHQGPVIIVGGILFGLQILFDFAAYSEIAIGAARIFGIELSKNFGNRSFFTSPIHMWSQWHITLTNWFRDYLYFPLTKLRRGRSFSMFALFITFLITGLWHGPAWGFIIWGGLHGLFLVVDHNTLKFRNTFFDRHGIRKSPRLLRFFSILVFLPFNWLSGIFFRADSIQDSFTILRRATDWSSIYFLLGNVKPFSQFLILPLLVFIELLNARLKDNQVDVFLSRQPTWYRWAFYIVITFLILFLHLDGSEISTFMYFQF